MGKKKGAKKKKNAWGEFRDAILPREHSPTPDLRSEPAAIAHTLTAERLHAILRSAESGDTRDLFSVYRDMVLGDTHLLAEFSKRKLAVLKEPVYFSPADPQNAADVKTAVLVQTAWAGMKGKMDALTHLLDASLYPVAVAEKTYRVSKIPGLRFEWGSDCGGPAIIPVAYHLLNFFEGRLRIELVDEVSKLPIGAYGDLQPMRHIAHRGHLLTGIPDNWGGPMRAALFWWLFKVMDRGWWVRFLERFGAPFTVAKYEDGRDDTKAMLERAFAAATRLFGLVVTKGTDVELLQANAGQSGDAFEQFKATADRELSKLIIGQTMTTEAQAAGIGSKQAEIHNEVRGDYEQFDAGKLAETLQDQLVDPFVALNALPGRCQVNIGQEDPGTAAETIQVLETLPKAGLEVADEGLAIISRRFGLPIVRSAPLDSQGFAAPAMSPSAPFMRSLGRATAGLSPQSGETAAAYLSRLRPTLLPPPHRAVRVWEAALAAAVAAGC